MGNGIPVLGLRDGVYSLTMTENPGDRRGAQRFALDLDLQFRELGDGPELARGAGKVVDMSSDAILFTPDCELKPGSRLEVSLSWPVRLDGRVALRLVARGVVMGFRDPNAVVAIQNYEFRTQRSAPDANNQAPKVS